MNLSTEGHTERARTLELTKESELWKMLGNSRFYLVICSFLMGIIW
jgi:hypothetical protein